MTTELTDRQIIDALGGTSEAARLCRVQPASVSGWRKNGIPPARRMFIELARPDIFRQDEPRRRKTDKPVNPSSKPQ